MTEIRTPKRIDAVTAPELDKNLKKCLAEGETNLRIDMEETVYISSVGLRAFVSAQKKLRNVEGGNMVLCHVSPSIMEIFEVTGFGSVLNFEE